MYSSASERKLTTKSCYAFGPLPKKALSARPRLCLCCWVPQLIGNQVIPWKRFWVPWTGNVRSDSDHVGFLEDPDGKYGKILNPDVRAVEELLTNHCVVLSGQPGLGKTQVFEQLVRNFGSWAQPQESLVAFHCRHIDGTSALRHSTVDNPCWREIIAQGKSIRLLIDGVDEALKRAPILIPALTELLRNESLDRIRVVITCRVAEWDAAAGESLKGLWHEQERTPVYELCQLRAKDVKLAAELCNLEAESFLHAVFAKRIQALAARPFTLRMLLDEYRAKKSFPNSYYELHAQAARRLCAEVDEERLQYLPTERGSDEQIHRVVARAAAAMMLCGKTAISKGDNPSQNETVLPITALIGGNEIVNNHLFHVTRNLVNTALDTAHFSFRGPNLYGFDHRVFAEHLTSEYLRHCSLLQLRRLLCIRLENTEYVAPQLSEVAAWLAAINSEWCDFLIATQPELLLRTDSTQLDVERKEKAIGALLAKAAREELFDEKGLSQFYSTLNHPNIAQQLRFYIIDRRYNIIVRRIAIEIAGDADVAELEPDLWQLVATDDPCFIPITHALRDLAGLHSKNHLLRALRGEICADTVGDLRGTAIQVLVPAFLSVKDVMPFLVTGRDPTYFGSYAYALDYHLPKYLQVDDLPDVLDRLIDTEGCFDNLHSFHRLAWKAFNLALEHIDEPKIGLRLVRLWRSKLRVYDRLPDGNGADDEDDSLMGLSNDKTRIKFARLLLNTPKSEEQDLMYYEQVLLTSSDLGWLLEELSSAAPSCRATWAKICARFLWGAAREEHRDLFLSRYAEVPELRAALPPISRWDIDTTLSRLFKAHTIKEERRQKRWRKKAKQTLSRAEWLKNDIYVLDHVNATGWVGISEHVWITADDDLPSDRQRRSYLNIKTAPGWKALSDVDREKAKAGARKFLLEYSDRSRLPDRYTNFASAAYVAINLLYSTIDVDSQLKAAIKAKWLRAICDNPFAFTEEEHIRMINLVYKLSPRLAISRLIYRLLKSDREDGYAHIMEAYSACWNKALSRAICNFLDQTQLNPRTTKNIILYLATYDHDTAIKIVDTLSKRRVQWKPFDNFSRAMLTIAIFGLKNKYWDALWPVLVSKPMHLVRELFLESCYDFIDRKTFAFDSLSDAQLADLFVLLMKLFPPDVYNRRNDSEGHVLPRHRIPDLRDGMLGVLVGRATPESCEQIRRAITLLPVKERIWIKWRYQEAIRGILRKSWSANVRTPNEVLTMARSSNALVVENADDLLDAVEYSLARLQARLLHRDSPELLALWNEAGHRRKSAFGASPKSEQAFSDVVANWLQHDLGANSGAVLKS